MKHYRIARIAKVNYQYPIAQFYSKNPELKDASYPVQQGAFFKEGYVYSDSFSRAMRLLGHEACEIVSDLELMQKAWAKENGAAYEPAQWQTDIVCAQLKAFKPDVIYLQGLRVLPYQILKRLKQEMPFIRLIIQYTCYPGAFNELKDVDVLFAGTPTMVQQYRDAGFQPQLLYHAFDETILKSLENNPDGKSLHKYDFTFIGSSGFNFGYGHQARFWVLVDLINRANIDLWIDEKVENISLSSFWSYLKKWRYWTAIYIIKGLRNIDSVTLGRIYSLGVMPEKVKMLISTAIDEKTKALNIKGKLPPKPIRKMFPKRCKPAVFGLEMYRVLQQSKITFNKHTDAALDSVGNMRMFEATGVGACLLTDTGKNMEDLFEDNREVVTYTTIDECIEKARYLLEHENIRRQIAIAGQKRTLKDHTMFNRCQQIDEIIQKRL